jgi:cbb3-type cytochrome oxidase subunit 1
MEGFVKRFILMGIIYLMIASSFGVLMVVQPNAAADLRFAHVHLNLLGWMSMLIFGVGYHILPRFSGKPLYSNKLGELQFWLANIGLIGLALISMTGKYAAGSPLYPYFVLAGLVEVLSIFIFGYNMIMTVFVTKQGA